MSRHVDSRCWDQSWGRCPKADVVQDICCRLLLHNYKRLQQKSCIRKHLVLLTVPSVVTRLTSTCVPTAYVLSQVCKRSHVKPSTLTRKSSLSIPDKIIWRPQFPTQRRCQLTQQSRRQRAQFLHPRRTPTSQWLERRTRPAF